MVICIMEIIGIVFDSSDNRRNRDDRDARDICGHITNTGHDMAHTFKAFSDGYIHNDRRTDAWR